MEAQTVSTLPSRSAHQGLEVAEGAGHAPVLEGGGGVLAVVLEIERAAHLIPQAPVGRHQGGVSFPQVQMSSSGITGAISSWYRYIPTQRREVEHAAIVEQPPPEGPGALGQGRGVFILQHEQAPASGAGVEEFGDTVFVAALQAAIDHLPGGLGENMGPDVVGKLFGFQEASKPQI